MTPLPYEIWDWETTNIVYAYATLEEALADVRNEVTVNGPESAATWFLQYDDRVRDCIVAEGGALVQQAFAASVSVPG